MHLSSRLSRRAAPLVAVGALAVSLFGGVSSAAAAPASVGVVAGNPHGGYGHGGGYGGGYGHGGGYRTYGYDHGNYGYGYDDDYDDDYYYGYGYGYDCDYSDC